ncbi:MULTISPECIES: alkene reductase [unclassified Bacillus (in: firmicutes)]|uniref:oxidoreductase n=1 Tax=unclassified Bacillus (in: firmicutes) TaxID=185979 RepID=UPI001BE4F4C5|nr:MULTISPECIES: alkene reductase [unclassified Bacillus (in: firmicutes)]MBT2619116.1 alkene reductase [Bacillus sp. ISL-78]MBT2632657.1 alkene reductase [Bacillus sp. ISL-101]MBT2717245.1 alkene reductase [Bacillus sp. ISL-57]
MDLIKPIQVNQWTLQSKVVMAPMTRGFADQETGVIHPDTNKYYTTRAKNGVGMIITEGIAISPEARGTIGIPGLYTDEQTNAWKEVTEGVHNAGGVIIAQLWHVGRLSHSYFTGGTQPLAPSSIQANGLTHKIRMPYEMPKAMTQEDIQKVICDFAYAAKNARKAGFDGVEIHAAHGYLIDQFQNSWTNFRKDEYGKNKYLFLEQILKAVGNEIGIEKLIVRFSEHKDDSPLYVWEQPEEEIKQIIDVFNRTGIQIIHPSAQEYTKLLTNHSLTLHTLVRDFWDKAIIGVGALTPEIAEDAVIRGEIQLAAFGRPLLANPDFVQRLIESRNIIKYNANTHLECLV